MGFMSNIFGKTDPYSMANLSVHDVYEKLMAYYDNAPYAGVQATSHWQGQWLEAIKPLRTSVHRSVEFFVARLCQGELVISADKEAAQDSIEQFLKWSNFESKKRTYIRSLALFGDLFLKVVSTRKKIYSESIDPRNVTDFKVDHRGFIQEIRIDVPMVDDQRQAYTYTEYWNKEYFASWNHHYGAGASLEQLGEADQFFFLAQMGIDFVPIVWIPFNQVPGKDRGESCVSHALSKIDEANRISTRLHQMLWRYNKPTFVVSANAVDKNNRPLPAPVIKGKSSSEERDLDILEKEIVYLPGMTSIESLIPQIDYAAALSVVRAMEEEIERDLPELRYFSLKESDLSGKAMKTLLAPSLDRAGEAKSNLEAGLVRLNEMALTIGKFLGLFPSVGSYENGDFGHAVDLGDAFTTDMSEKASELKALTDAGVPLGTAMKICGFSEEVTAEAVATKNQETDKALGRFIQNFNEV